MTTDWETKAAGRRQRLRDTIPQEWRLKEELLKDLKAPLESSDNNVLELGFCKRSGILSDKELSITESYTVSELLESLASAKLTASEVTVAFCKRAAIAHQLTNCCTEIFFDKAQQTAKELDALRTKGEPLGPLHGLPVSVKDNIQVAGIPATLGLVGFIDDVSEKNSAVVDILLANGAVIYCKTNVPQTMMTIDTHNNVFGRTLNPLNTSLSAGGSSGGEGALVGFRGSPLGLGTDVGGMYKTPYHPVLVRWSVRFPSACCGIYGFRPTTGRIPAGDVKACTDPGMRQIRSCIGPMAGDVDALATLMKVVINARPWKLDGTTTDVPWRNVELEAGQKLRIGILPEDPALPLHPPIRDAVKEAAAKLAAAGHVVVQLEPADCRFYDALQAAFALFMLDATAARIVDEAGEPTIPSRVALQKGFFTLPWTYLADVKGLEGLERLSALNRKRAEIVRVWHATYTKHSLDATIGPLMQHTAAEHDQFGSPAYGTTINLIDYPSCTIPFGKASGENPEPFETKPGQFAPKYVASKSNGMPRALQIVTPTMRDEECLAIAKVIDTCLNK